MLTFFEYLRQRAFESIVAGVQDALASLESKSHASDFELPEKATARPTPLGVEGRESRVEGRDGRSADSGNRQSDATAANSNKLPAPRRRGRPPKSERSS